MLCVTKDARFKKTVRARMAVTGEPYMAARRALLEQREREAEADADKAFGMFDRFDTDEAFLASFEEPDR